MMTGEWNISSLDEIRATTAQRRLEQSTLYTQIAPDILVDDHEGFATYHGLPGVEGKTTAPLCLWEAGTNGVERECCNAVVATTLLDSGYALALPLAKGFVAAAGSPWDPFVVAAHAWQRPVVVGLGKVYRELSDGAPTVVDVNAETVTVSQG